MPASLETRLLHVNQITVILTPPSEADVCSW